MKQSLQLRLGQQLTMTPQLQQAIRLLQLSALELQAEVQEALESNMMLELAEEGGTEPGAAEAEGTVNGEEFAGATSEVAGEAAAAGDEPPAGSGTLDEGVQSEEIPQDLPVDTGWEDIYEGAGASGAAGSPVEGPVLEQPASSGGLQEHLLWQLNLMSCSDRDRAIATAIIDAIDEQGYLRSSPEELLATIGDESVEADELEAVLHLVQSLDPPGVAARDLGECLTLQLRQLPAGTPWLEEARRLVSEHLDLLAARNYKTLMRRMHLDKEELQEVIGLIQTLNPRPGAALDQRETEYIVPDVFVRKVEGAWKVELNQEALPRLRLNRHYTSLMRQVGNGKDLDSLRKHLQEARWFIKSLRSRSETLLRVATAIVERQQGFLEYGEEAMKPMVLADIAEALGMHESTISRVTTRKYMHTPRGIFELKYFFSSHVGTSLGGEASSTAIRAVIRKLIAAEDPARPLSDSRIAAILKEQGINVARRTVAKYRESMQIPPSNERRRLA
ncbi:MAG: RNA polymerase factor sigma-54 [Gammaproteobacteria bacterium]|nr:MAG: RNA polymerase factor sigma-54 [Gammaproteobacteria bacterium]